MKPSLIYIVNQESHSNFDDWSDVASATKRMLEKWRRSPRFTKEQALWRERGTVVDNADQLLRCYYREVKVVFIPHFKPKKEGCEASELQDRYRILYEEIVSQSWISSEHRMRAAILFNLESISRLSMGVLEQLAKDPHGSVDLRRLAEPFQPYPTNFNSHVLNILTRLRSFSPRTLATQHDAIGSEESLCRKVTAFLTTCIVRVSFGPEC